MALVNSLTLLHLLSPSLLQHIVMLHISYTHPLTQNIYVCVCVSHSVVSSPLATPWTYSLPHVACQAPPGPAWASPAGPPPAGARAGWSRGTAAPRPGAATPSRPPPRPAAPSATRVPSRTRRRGVSASGASQGCGFSGTGERGGGGGGGGKHPSATWC